MHPTKKIDCLLIEMLRIKFPSKKIRENEQPLQPLPTSPQKKNYQFFQQKKTKSSWKNLRRGREDPPFFFAPDTLAALASELGLGRAEVGLTGGCHIASHPSNLQESSSNHPITTH